MCTKEPAHQDAPYTISEKTFSAPQTVPGSVERFANGDRIGYARTDLLEQRTGAADRVVACRCACSRSLHRRQPGFT